MTESITLPRSGIVLTWSEHSTWFQGTIGAVHPTLYTNHTNVWRAMFGDLPTFVGTREECIAWLDERVLALRSALTPADAVERVARRFAYFEGYATWEASAGQLRDRYVRQAKDVLAALGVDHE